MATPDVSPTPRFSIVVATYNVAQFLGEFIQSIEGQTFPVDRLQVIAVNDGSTDDSLAILEAWRARRPELVTVVSKENGGLPSARNAGLPHVRGDWVTFTDPDDILARDYFAEVDAFLLRRPAAYMVATNRAPFNEVTGEEILHPLRRHFVAGVNRLRDLNVDTGHFHGHAASTFFRTKEIQRAGLTFDERLRTTFEDGHFCSVYLLHAPRPTVAYLPDAVYHYRKRGDGTSQLDRSWADPSRFTDVLEHGYLALLQAGVERYGRAPLWLQGMVIYELGWYLKMNERMSAPTAAQGETLTRYHELMAQICALLDRAGIDTYRATRIPAIWREMLEHGYRDEPWHTPYAVVDRLDDHQKLIRITYRFTGELPTEAFAIYSKLVEPVHQKIRDIRLFDRTVLQERIVWLPYGTVRVSLNGESLEVRTTDPRPPDYRLTSAAIRKGLAHEPDEEVTEAAEAERSASDRMVLRLARSKLVRWYFRDAWVLIDRVFNADDSAEHLFRYLRKNRPEVNAWFVIERGTPDDRRLRREGYGRRVIAHGSRRWKLLMLNAVQLVSSHIDEVVIRPKEIRRLADPRWRVAFLQHGVMKDDLSTWLNHKNIDIFVTSTPAEWHSVVDDHTTYRYTDREAKLTGLPRFDRLLEEAERLGPDQRNLILVAPTWRQWLSDSDSVVTGRHSVREEFADSEYAREWSAVLNSPELADLAERSGLQVALLLHPNFQDSARLDVGPHVRELSFEGQNVQETFARARVLVTDYSSMFFNAAYLERPVVYFQFDHERVNAGWHLGRHGYFDYERDGYGPVTFSADQAVAAITKTVEGGPEPDPLYLERIRASFPQRDGRCCERVADAIIESMGPDVGGPRPSFGAAVRGRLRRSADGLRAPFRRRTS